MFQLAAVSLTFLALVALFLSSHIGSGVFEHAVDSRYIRFGGSRVPPPDFNSFQLKVDIDEPADDPIWDTQNRTLGVRNIRKLYKLKR
jgi:hypothetical protein